MLLVKIFYRGVARNFQRRGELMGGGGGVTLCHTQGTYQFGMSISRPCFTTSDIVLDEQ